MNVLIAGGGGKGSWTMRGQQLGRAVGARVVTAPTLADAQWADVAVLVKSASVHAPVCRAAGTPIVWDALDFWQQPEQNGLSEFDAKQLLASTIKTIRPALVIGATQAMADACGGVYLPHHTWIGLTPGIVRPEVKTVGYQGAKKYLGRWAKALKAECDRRGWTLLINPTDLRACDIVVAFRDGQWDGWMCREWKSGVKLVNALAAWRPIVTQPSAAFREIRPYGTTIESPDELPEVLDLTRLAIERNTAWPSDAHKNFTLPAIATQYKALLERVANRVAA